MYARKAHTMRSHLRGVSVIQKRFIYRLLARHEFLPVWLVADNYPGWRRKNMYRTDCDTAHPVLLNRLSKVNTSCGPAW